MGYTHKVKMEVIIYISFLEIYGGDYYGQGLIKSFKYAEGDLIEL